MAVEYDTETGEVRATRELRRSGNSVVVSIPPAILHEAGFQKGDGVVLVAGSDGGEIKLMAPDTDSELSVESTHD